jgi:hypothetical protein
MSRGNSNIRLWLDVKLGRFWYVIYWPKGSRVTFYRSTDATPPCADNEGRYFLRGLDLA